MSSLFPGAQTRDEALLTMDKAFKKSKQLHILQFLNDQKDLQRRLEMCQFRSDNANHATRRESTYRLRPLTAQPRRTSSGGMPADQLLSSDLLLCKEKKQTVSLASQLAMGPHDENTGKLFTDEFVLHREPRRPESARNFRIAEVAKEEFCDVFPDEVDLEALSVTSVRSESPTLEDLENSDELPLQLGVSVREVSKESSLHQGNSKVEMLDTRRQLLVKNGRRSLVVPNVNWDQTPNGTRRYSAAGRYQAFDPRRQDDRVNETGGQSSKHTLARHKSAPTGLQTDEMLVKFGRLGFREVSKRNVFSAHQPLPPLQSPTPSTALQLGQENE